MLGSSTFLADYNGHFLTISGYRGDASTHSSFVSCILLISLLLSSIDSMIILGGSTSTQGWVNLCTKPFLLLDRLRIFRREG